MLCNLVRLRGYAGGVRQLDSGWNVAVCRDGGLDRCHKTRGGGPGMGDMTLLAKDAHQEAKTTRLLLLYSNAAAAGDVFERLATYEHAVMLSPIAAAIERWEEQLDPDLVVIVANGDDELLIERCGAIRERTTRPIAVLADSCEDQAIVRALNAGADEFVPVSASDAELFARIDALLRRHRRTEYDRWEAGNLTLCASTLSVECDGRRVLLTPNEFRLLSCLASAPGKVFTHETLMSRVWGVEYVDARHYLYLYIRYLREKLEQDPKQPRIIMSEWGVGYRLAA